AGSRATALALVFSELLQNALEHGAGTVRIELAQRNGDVVLAIADEGSGADGAASGTGVSVVRGLVAGEIQGSVGLHGTRGAGGGGLRRTSWLGVLRRGRAEMPFEPTEEEARIVSEHYEYLKQLRAEGRLVLAGPSAVPADAFGLGIFDQDDRADVEAIVAADPAVTGGIMTAEIRPYRISVR